MAVHNFDTKIAKKYGVAEAVVLWNLCYWQNHNEANKKNFHEERYWTYNSVSAFSEIFEYLSKKQIERILLKLEKEKVLLSGRFNKMKIDRTKWYSVESEIMALHGFQSILPNGEMQTTKTSNANDKNVECKRQKKEMDFTKRGNGFHQMGEPIPDSKTDNKNILKEEFDFFFNDSNFLETFEEFKQIRKALKAPATIRKALKAPATKKAEKLILNKLVKFSNKDIKIAIEILERSIENGWKGVFELNSFNQQKEETTGKRVWNTFD